MQPRMPQIVPRYIIVSLFIIGLVSAIAFRAIIIFQHLEPQWVRPVWYIGVLGYLIFFFYRYMIARKRKTAIEKYQLIEKIRANACLAAEERDVVLYLLSSIRTSLEDLNYAIIFLLSLIAIVADLILSTLK